MKSGITLSHTASTWIATIDELDAAVSKLDCVSAPEMIADLNLNSLDDGVLARKRYEHVSSPGNSHPSMDIYVDLRRREPSTRPLLINYVLVKDETVS